MADEDMLARDIIASSVTKGNLTIMGATSLSMAELSADDDGGASLRFLDSELQSRLTIELSKDGVPTIYYLPVQFHTECTSLYHLTLGDFEVQHY